MSDIFRKLLAALVVVFLESGSQKTKTYFYRETLQEGLDDQIHMKEGKVVRVTMEYIDENDPDIKGLPS